MTFNYLNLPHLPKLKETTINGKRHYVTEDGLILPSVTTILSAQPKPQVDAWAKRLGPEKVKQALHKATTRGNGLHFLIESFLNNDDISSVSAMPDATEMMFALRPYLNKINNIHYLEVPLFSKLMGMAGRADCIAHYDGLLSIVDFKQARKTRTEAMVHSYLLQATAYAGLYEDMTGMKIKQIVVMMAVENAKPQIFIKNPRQYVPDLINAIKTYKNSLDLTITH